MITVVRLGGPTDEPIQEEQEERKYKFRHSNKQGTEVRELTKAFDMYGVGIYSVSGEEAKRLAIQYQGLNGIEYMNMEFLAAAINMLEHTMRDGIYRREIITPESFQRHKDGILQPLRSNRESVKETTLLRYVRNIVKYRFPDRYDEIFSV
jgi:hypothetical protein